MANDVPTPTEESLAQRVIRVICEQLGVDPAQVTRATSFQNDLGTDSLDLVELVMKLEDEFGVTIPDDQAEKIKTVGDAVDYIEKKG